MRMANFEEIKSELQCLEGEGKTSNVSKDQRRIPVFRRTRQEFQCLEG